MRHFKYILFVLVLAGACRKVMPKAPPDDELLDGPVEGLTNEERLIFARGDDAFNNQVFTPETGLGPIFVASSCASCHAGDGKGHPFTSLTRFGQTDSTGNKFLSKGAPQLQNRAIPGYEPESIPDGATSAKILPPANSGLGYIDAVSDADIIAMSDPNDLDDDGISGVTNWIKMPAYCKYREGSVSQNGRHIGRFGKKGGAYDLLQQTANAYNQDMGITSTFESLDTYSGLQSNPEVSNSVVHDVVFYLRSLKAPKQRNADDAAIRSGRDVFNSLGCEGCHKSKLKTGDYMISAIANQTFAPYTDLLLHDMGPGLDDGYTEGTALTSEWRTPALWGLGLSKLSQGGSYYLLHDGRAKSIDEAILLHGGEGEKSKQNYAQLSAPEKEKLIKFLESL